MDKAKLLAEIVANSGPPLRQPNDFTWQEFAEAWEKERGERLTEHRAGSILSAQVKAGKLLAGKRYDISQSRMRCVWWKA